MSGPQKRRSFPPNYLPKRRSRARHALFQAPEPAPPAPLPSLPSELAAEYPLAAALPPLARSHSHLSLDSTLREYFGEESSDALTLLRCLPWVFTDTQRQQIQLREVHYRNLPESPSPPPSPDSAPCAIKIEPDSVPSPIPPTLPVPGPLPPPVLLPVKLEVDSTPGSTVAQAPSPVARLPQSVPLPTFPSYSLDSELREVFGIATSTHYTLFKCAPGTFSDLELQQFETFHRTWSSTPSPLSTPGDTKRAATTASQYSPAPSQVPDNLPLLEFTQPPFPTLDPAARLAADPELQALCLAANRAFTAGAFKSESQSSPDFSSVPVPASVPSPIPPTLSVPVPVPVTAPVPVPAPLPEPATVPSPTDPDPVFSGYAEYEV